MTHTQAETGMSPDAPSASRGMETAVVLADSIAADYAACRTRRGTVASLAGLLPTLKFFNVGVAIANGALLSSPGRCQAGPRSLALHALASSCMGMTLAKGTTVSASLAGAAGDLLLRMTDVAELARLAPQATHVVCVPVAPPEGTAGGAQGALLLGFSSPPDLSPRRVAGVAALASLLSLALARTAPEVVCRVESMVGSHQGCWCCCPDSDDEEAAAPDDGDACGGAEPRGRRGPPPREPLLVPIPEGDDEADWSDTEASSPSSSCPPSPPPKAPATPPPPAPARGPFSKQAVAAVSAAALAQKGSLLLRYRDQTLEAEFQGWHQRRVQPLDALFAVLVLVAMGMLWACGPTPAPAPPVASPLLAAPLLLPFLMAACPLECHRRWRETVVAAVRLYLALAAGLVAGRAGGCAVPAPPSALACWVAAGGETLLTPALGLQLRMAWHLPCQLAAVALLLAGSGAGVGAAGAAAAGLLGFVAPTVALRVAEVRSRRTFEAQISSVAGVTNA